MALLQRLLSLGLVPLIALLALQLFSPGTLHDVRDTLQSYIKTQTRDVVGTAPLARSETPLIVSAFPHFSHYEKIAKVAVRLAELGYPITFITGRIFEKEASSLHPNITYYPLLGEADKLSEEDYKTFASLPPGSEEAELFIQKAAVVDGMKASHDTLQQVFQDFRTQYGTSKPLLSFYDSVVVGHIPVLLGAPGIRPDASFAIGIHPITLDSNDTYPFHIHKLPEQGPDARDIHWKAYQARHEHYRTREFDLYWWAKLRELGAIQDTYPSFLHGVVALPEHLMVLGVPEFDFPRSDLRSNLHYFGALKSAKKTAPKVANLPSWWDDLAKAKKEGKKIVAVSQGTVEINLNDLLVPTLEALKDRDDVLVIASTVVVEPEDVPDLVLPANARAAKFIPYDDLLPLVDVLVNNGGYGAVLTALHHGIPIVVAGAGQDKGRTNMLVEWTGVGVNLHGRAPGVEKIRDGITKVIEDGEYKRKVKEMSRKFDRYDMGEVFDGAINMAVQEWKEKTNKE